MLFECILVKHGAFEGKYAFRTLICLLLSRNYFPEQARIIYEAPVKLLSKYASIHTLLEKFAGVN